MNRAQAVATRILAIRGSHPISTVVLTSQESKTFQSALIEDSRWDLLGGAINL